MLGPLFFPEGGGKESTTQAASLLAATDPLAVCTGIADIYLRHAAPAEAASRTRGYLSGPDCPWTRCQSRTDSLLVQFGKARSP